MESKHYSFKNERFGQYTWQLYAQNRFFFFKNVSIMRFRKNLDQNANNDGLKSHYFHVKMCLWTNENVHTFSDREILFNPRTKILSQKWGQIKEIQRSKLYQVDTKVKSIKGCVWWADKIGLDQQDWGRWIKVL